LTPVSVDRRETSVSETPPVRSSLSERDREQGSHLADVALVALERGCLAFGGPAAHIAMLREEVVVRRHWLSEQEFLDLLGITNLIPGPNSTEMVILCSYRRAGWPDLLVGGILFIFPAAAIVLA
jgi:chromate transporter